MAELFLFSQDDEFITLLSEDEGLVDTWFKDYENHVEDEFFVFNIDSNSELLQYIVEENQVAFYDRDGRLRLARMKDLREITTNDDGMITHEIKVICEPSFLELHDHFVEDRRVVEGTAQTALNRALDGSRYIGEVTVELGNATDNFYWIDGIEAVFKILKTWGGALKDTITLNEDNEIIERKMWIVQRLGTDNGLIIEPDYNAEEISRNTLSYPETALWGQGASLEIEDEEGELTGGHTRYITFEDVEWKVENGDPVDKPKGQKWVGDPDALAKYGYIKDHANENLLSQNKDDYIAPLDERIALKERPYVNAGTYTISNYSDVDYVKQVTLRLETGSSSKPLYTYDLSKNEATFTVEEAGYLIVYISVDGSKITSKDALNDLGGKLRFKIEEGDHGTAWKVKRNHRFGHFSNQDYEDPEELLWATWQELQDRKLKEIMHEATIYESDKKVSLGDTATILNREYNKPIELQSQITGLEYDILYPDDEIKIVVGKYVDMNEDPLEKEVEDLKQDIRKPRPTKPIDNGSFPDIKPGTPVNVEAHGSFQQIHLFWDYDSNVYISHYEVYGSQISDFVPDEQHLLYRGRVSAFIHEVDTDEKWYYYVRAVNTRGTVGEFSNRVDASSVRVISDDILFGEIIADHLDDNLDIADKLAQNTIDRINEGPMEAIEYTQQEIEDAEKSILEKLNNEIGDVNTAITDLLDRTSDVESTVTNVKTDIDTINGEISATIEELTNLDDVVSQHTLDIQANAKGLSAKAEKSEVYTRTATDNLLGDKVNVTTYENKMTQLDIDVSGISGRVSNTETNINDLTGDMSSAMSQIGELDVKANNINASVSEVRADLDGLEIGGRNLLKGTSSEFDRYERTHSWGDFVPYDNVSIVPGEIYTVRAYLKNIEGSKNVQIKVRMEGSTYVDFNGNKIPPGKEGYSLVTFTVPDSWTEARVMVVRFDKKVTEKNIIDYKEVKLEKGNRATDWSPAPEDIDANLSEMKSSIDLKADSATLEVVSRKVNTNTGNLETAMTSLEFFRNEIKLKVDVDGVISSINLSKEGVRIDGNKHHITGQTLIDDGVIGTAAIANLAVDRFHLKQGIIDNVHIADATIEHTKMKSLNVDHVVAGEMDLVHLRAGTIDGNKIKLRGGSGNAYASFDGEEIETRGEYRRTWFGNTEIHDVGIQLRYGRLRFHNYGNKRNLYFSETGITTYIGGSDSEGGGYQGSGTIEFFSHRFDNDIRGLTLYSNRGTIGLQTDTRDIILDADRNSDIRSRRGSVLIKPHIDTRTGYNHFRFAVKDHSSARDTDGYIVYGSPNTDYASGIRFKKSRAGEALIWATDGSGSPATGSFYGASLYGDLKPRGTYAYAIAPMLRVVTSDSKSTYGDLSVNEALAHSIRKNPNTSGDNFYIGTSNGEVRVTNNLLWQGSHGDTTYRPIRTSKVYETSSEKYKTDIQKFDKSALDLINQSVIYDYYKDGSNQREIGLIIEREMPSCIIDGNAVDGYSMRSLSWKAIQELDNKFISADDRINILELENQYLKQKIKSLEEKVA